jgi:signal transduction histidine kinase
MPPISCAPPWRGCGCAWRPWPSGADPDIRRAIAASLVDADRLEATIDELLALARAGQVAAAGPVDLGALICELSPEWGARLALHGRELEVQVDPGVPDARASTAAVRQVLGVLVDNASTHGRGTVAVTVREASGAVAIDVSDEGPGVQDLEGTVFAQRADRRDGHGIGLALARRLAEAEQGRLTLSRTAPPVFTLLLPAAADTADAQGTGVAVARSAGRERTRTTAATGVPGAGPPALPPCSRWWTAVSPVAPDRGSAATRWRARPSRR